MESDKLEHIRDFVHSKRGELREEVTEALFASDAGRALVLKHCRAAGAAAHARRVGRENSPFALLLRPEGIGAVPFETWAARHDAWLEGWDAAAGLALD